MKRLLSLTLLLATFALIDAAVLPAQNAIVIDPEFDDFSDPNFPGWIVIGANPDPGEDADLCPDSFSYRIESGGPAVGARSLDCLEVDFDDVLHLEISYRSDAPVDLVLQPFSDSSCQVGGISVIQPPEFPESADWTTLRVERTITANVGSVQLRLKADDSEAYWVEFDRAYLGFAERIFADDFDGGSFCRWTEFVDGFEI